MNSARLDLLLINPPSRTEVYQSLGNELAAVENPVWAGLVASYARKHGLSVEILDAEALGMSATEVADAVAQARPQLCCVVVYGHQPSASTQNMTAAGKVCNEIKSATPDQPLLLIGGHIAALPRRTMLDEACDFVAAGEGLATVVALVEALKTIRPRLDRVPGLWYRDGDVLRSNPDASLVGNLDRELPGFAWDLLPMERYRAHNWHCLGGLARQPYAAVYTTLGCPFHCTFCCIQAPFRPGEQAAGLSQSTNSYRYWSPQHVLDQIDILVDRHGVRNLKIADEMFVLNPRHVLAICDGIVERGYDLNIWAYSRVDTIKDRFLEKLAAAGFRWLAFGIEAGSSRVRDDVDKDFTDDELRSVMAKVRSADISVIGNYIFGLPEDDVESMQATLDLALDLNCEFGNFYSAMAYPGSALYAKAERVGVALPDRWTGYSQHSRDCLPLPTKYLTARDVLEFRDRAFHYYYNSPSYLAMIERRYGTATAEHIRAMASHFLQRDLFGQSNDSLSTLPSDGWDEPEPALVPLAPPLVGERSAP